MKRVRSRKIENDRKLAVLHEKSMDPSKLQEYTGYLLTTGVEREEEEEHHLKVIISGESGNIPTPKIEKSEGPGAGRAPGPAGAAQEDASYLEDTGDVPNTYVLSSRDARFLEAQNCPAEAAALIIRQAHIDSPLIAGGAAAGAEALSQYFATKLITAADKPLTDPLASYVCFRKRETRALRKARKPDTSVERIKKIKVDLQMVRRLAELVVQRDTYLLNHLNTILSIFNICREMNKRLDLGVLSISETILRDILFTKLIDKSDHFHKKVSSFGSLYTCRKSIASLKKLFRTKGAGPGAGVKLSGQELRYLSKLV